MRSEVTLKLTQEEFKLVGLGLAGKLKGQAARDALKLNVRLLEQQEAYLEELRNLTAGALVASRAELEEKLAELGRTQPEG